MKFVNVNGGESYTPKGHDANVVSHVIYKERFDIHTTMFPGGAGMEEEVHEDMTHVFYVLQGSMEVLQRGERLAALQAGDSVVIYAGEPHEIRNPGPGEMRFLAVTFPDSQKTS